MMETPPEQHMMMQISLGWFKEAGDPTETVQERCNSSGIADDDPSRTA
jgi:hypothetical protein